MRLLFTIALFFTSLIATAQIDSAGLKITMQQLDKALLGKDEAVLKQVLHKNVSYAHSNGWIQSKDDILNDFKSGKLVYNKIENNSVRIVNISDKWATVATNTNAEGVVNGNAFKLVLQVMQVWMKTKKGWQLYARQSAKQG
ncbi:MAG: nuclear transport factor 2 family protein [Bacteroidetes bacterium]|nr:MAG: nuclear transport factor 2 family protein [Bacteroidota bacterium]